MRRMASAGLGGARAGARTGRLRGLLVARLLRRCDALLERLEQVGDRRLGCRLRRRDGLAGDLRVEHRAELAAVLVLELLGRELAGEARDHLTREVELDRLDLRRLDGAL